MEEEPPVKSLVAELAGKLKDHALPVPRNEERKPVLSSPQCYLQLHNQPDGESEKEKPAVAPPTPAKPKLKNSPFVEKLQANLALTPTALLPSAKSPEPKQQTVPFFLISPCGPQSPTLRPPQQPDDNEMPVSFEQPPEGNLLSSFNKSRVRLSFKRRPPTRQHRKSAGEDVTPDTHDGDTSSCDRHSVDNGPVKNGDEDAEEVLCSPLEEAEEQLKDSTPTVTEQDTEQQEENKDETQDNEENRDSEGEKGELEREDRSDQSETSEPVEILHEEKPCAQESSEEGLEKEESTPMEENDKQQVLASAD